MNSAISLMEKVSKGTRIALKVFYYKIKYGKQLKIGKKVRFRKGFIINISKNGKVEIGDGTFFNNYCSINCHKEVKIGKNNLFGEGVKIYDHNHVFNDKSVNMKKSYKSYPIIIGDNNWFGSNIVILSKTRIGNNNVFGANMIINYKVESDHLIKNKKNLDIEIIHYKDNSNE